MTDKIGVSGWLDEVRRVATVTDVLAEYAEDEHDLDIAMRIVPFREPGLSIEVYGCKMHWGLGADNLGGLALRLRMPRPKKHHLFVAGIEPSLSDDILISYCDQIAQGDATAEALVHCGRLIAGRMRLKSGYLPSPAWFLRDSVIATLLPRHYKVVEYRYSAWKYGDSHLKSGIEDM